MRYGEHKILDAVTLAVNAHGTYALVGPAGAGKTTLLRCLIGLEKPRIGGATCFGEDPWRERARLVRRIAFVAQEPDAPGDARVAELLRLAERSVPGFDTAAARDALAREEVPPASRFGRLSPGGQLAVLVALGLARRPDLLVLDDPLPAADAAARKRLLRGAVEEVRARGGSVLVTARDAAWCEGLVDRVGLLETGVLVLDQPVAALHAHFRRITYRNEASDEREPGTELDRFHAVRVKVRGWGIEAVVSNFDERAFEAFAAQDGVVDARSSALTLAEILAVLARRA